jgi:glyoxylase-like metal-dependent hydrolase (beta-lactamase superfamily II)
MKTRALVWMMSVAGTMAAAGESEVPGTFEYALGETAVTTLAERQQSIGRDKLIGATDEIMKRCAPDGTVPNAVNAFLVRAGGTRLLVDTGLGIRLIENLTAAGAGPGDIDAVLITHMHRDHIGGLLRGGAAVFTNAAVYIARPEFEYWKGKGDDAEKIEAAYQGRLRLFEPQSLDAANPEPLVPGVTAFAAYGHTPGHTVFLVEGGNKKLLVWGDLTHATAIQVPHPEVAVTYDADPAQAVETRRKVFAYAAANHILVAGMHIAYPGVVRLGRQEKSGGYHMKPVD